MIATEPLALTGRTCLYAVPCCCHWKVNAAALEFCLVVTQRRNVADTRLRVTGPVATEWSTIAQAFAGAPTDGRPAGRFAALPVAGRS